MEKFTIKRIWPYLAAIVLFIILGMAYFSPVLEGKKLKQSDIVHFKGMSKEIVDYREATGKEALWTNSMFSGMPAYQISVHYKNVFVKYVDDIFKMGLPHPINLVFLYFIGFFILLLVLRVNIWLAILGSVAFAFSSYFFIILEAGHNSKAHAIAYMAPVMAGIIMTYRKKYLWGFALTTLFLSLQILTNHLQITYYLMLMVILFGIAQLIDSVRKKEVPQFIKASLILVAAAILSVGVNISSIWATYEYGKDTIRGKSELTTAQENRTSGLDIDYATAWSYGVAETMTLLIPDFMGGGSGEYPSLKSDTYAKLTESGLPEQQARQYIQYFSLYWGNQPFTSGPVYVGAIMIFLFVLGIFVVKGKMKWWLVAATILSIMLAWGHNFMPLTKFFLHYIPGYNKFRAVSMTLVIAEFAIPLLGILALRDLFNSKMAKEAAIKKLKLAFYITGGITLFFAILPGMFFSFNGQGDGQLVQAGFPAHMIDALRTDRAAVLRSDAIRSFIFILLAAVLLWAALLKKLKSQYVYIALIVLLLIDLWTVNKRYVNNENFESARKVDNPYTPTAANLEILKDRDPNFRVYNLAVSTYKDASTSYFHKSLGGYHGAKLRRYQELIDSLISRNNMYVLNMLNTKYFIVRGQNNQPEARINPDALGNAWIVDDYRIVENADEEIVALKNFNPSTLAIVDKRYAPMIENYKKGSDSLASIQMIKYLPNELVYQFKSGKEELAVFSEIYYDKGWNVYVDGEKVPYFRANYVLRAMLIPAGDHEIVWKFEPKVYYMGGNISLVCSLIVFLIFFAALGNELKDVLVNKQK
nr:YfhO family protein [Bacteroidota bacterium]